MSIFKLPKKALTTRAKKSIKRVAVLCSGGDAPGMNAAVRAVVRTAIANDLEVFGISRGYAGLLEGKLTAMNASSVANIIQRGGTIIKTSRCPEFMQKSGRAQAAKVLKAHKIDALIVIGGDGSFTGAQLLSKEFGINCIGLPGTIDNDVYGTDDTIGFDTAVNTAVEAIDRIRDTASSHDRLFLVEVMGRHAGFIALQVGICGGAESILIPEYKVPLSQICKSIDRGVQRGKLSSIIVVAEGYKGGNATELAKEFAAKKYKPKVAILGHIQRGGTPSAHDRFLASSLGAYSVHAAMHGMKNVMVGVENNQIVFVPFSKVISKKKSITKEYLTIASELAV